MDWRHYPVGTKAPAIMGGHWYRVERGWKWNGPNGSGDTFPTPGGDADGTVILPDLKWEEHQICSRNTKTSSQPVRMFSKYMNMKNHIDNLKKAVERVKEDLRHVHMTDRVGSAFRNLDDVNSGIHQLEMEHQLDLDKIMETIKPYLRDDVAYWKEKQEIEVREQISNLFKTA